MQVITNSGIEWIEGEKGFRYSIIEERCLPECATIEMGKIGTLGQFLDERRELYQSLGYYTESTNSYSIGNHIHYTACSLLDLAFTGQDRERYSFSDRGKLCTTQEGKLLRAAYNQGIIQILLVQGMSQLLIEKAVEKIHREELISPFLLGQGLHYRKESMGITGKTIIVDIIA